MKRDFIYVKLDYEIDWQYHYMPLDEVRMQLDEIESLGGTHINIDGSSFYDSVEWNNEAVVYREETEEEFLQRKKSIELVDFKTKVRELRMLRELREKYNIDQ